jgi:hypothetical protein
MHYIFKCNISGFQILKGRETQVVYHGKGVNGNWWVVAGLLPQRNGLDPRCFSVGFVIYKVPLGHGFLRVIHFSPVNIISPLRGATASFVDHRHCVCVYVYVYIHDWSNRFSPAFSSTTFQTSPSISETLVSGA